MKTKKQILKALDNAMVMCFDSFTWYDVIEGTDLTNEEKEWAKQNTGYMVRDYTKEREEVK